MEHAGIRRRRPCCSANSAHTLPSRHPTCGIRRCGNVNLALCLEDKLLAGGDAQFFIAVVAIGNIQDIWVTSKTGGLAGIHSRASQYYSRRAAHDGLRVRIARNGSGGPAQRALRSAGEVKQLEVGIARGHTVCRRLGLTSGERGIIDRGARVGENANYGCVRVWRTGLTVAETC
jgi:hypothetical protein